MLCVVASRSVPVLAQSLGRFGKSRVGVTFPDRAAGQPSQMIGAVGAQTRPKFEFCARPKCTDWNKTRIFALVLSAQTGPEFWALKSTWASSDENAQNEQMFAHYF